MSSSSSSSSFLPSSFLIINGDTLTDLDMGAVIDEHRRTRALVTMAVVPQREPEKYGSVIVDRDGIVSGFSGRGTIAPRTIGRTVTPSHPRTLAPFHFIGVQVAEAEAFASVPPRAVAESVGEVYPELIRTRPGAVRAYATDAAFLDIGTPGDYLQAALGLATRNGGACRGAHTHVDATAHIENSLLWDDVTVGAGASLRRCVVTDGVRVPDGTSWTSVTLRRAGGDLASGERLVGDLAVAAI